MKTRNIMSYIFLSTCILKDMSFLYLTGTSGTAFSATVNMNTLLLMKS